MIKHLLLILLSFGALINASSPDDDIFFLQRQELFYDAGISLAHQERIINWQSFKDAGVAVYNEVKDFQDIVNLILMMSEDFDEDDTLSFDQLLDVIEDAISESGDYENFKADLIIFVASYQRIFSIFTKMYPSEPAFETFISNLNDYNVLDEEMKDALNNFANAYCALQNRLEDQF